MGIETRFVAKLFQKAGLRIAYTTRHTIGQLLTHNIGNRCNKCEGNGVYQLACVDCNRHSVGQTGRPFCTHFKEHARYYQHSKQKSQYAKHLLDNKHALYPTETSMTILHNIKKGRMLKTLDKFHIYKETKQDNQNNDRHTVAHNAIFDVILNTPAH
jgi:hypothetical protein